MGKIVTFQELVEKLNAFWAKQGCIIAQPYDIEKGAGTFSPSTFLRCLGPEPYSVAYIEPCRRPKDGRYGITPNRLQHYFQYQVLLKPSPYNILDLYLQSFEAVGLSIKEHDIRFVHDDWESPTIGAWGLGWEVWIDGQESSQFTYFQSVAGIPQHPITGEITYGLERLAMYLQNVDSVYKLQWNDTYTYGDLYHRSEVEWSTYNFEESNISILFSHFEDFQNEAKRLIQKKLPLPAYDFVIKASHTFNLLDARGAISVTERASYIAKIRDLAKLIAEEYIVSREKLGFPLLANGKTKETVAQKPKIEATIPMNASDFVLEIGVEELPATFIPIGLQNLEKKLTQLLKAESIGFKKITTLGTPRRLAILIEGLEHERKAETVEKRGPALSAAFTEKGDLTQIGEGFFRSIGKEAVSRDELSKDTSISIREFKGAEYLFYTHTKPQESTVSILEKALPQLILSVEFPKVMRWADLDISFARPIRWLLALFDAYPLSFSLGPITSGNTSQGHRLLDPSTFSVIKASEYKETLRKHSVIVDIEERRQEIENSLLALEKEQNIRIIEREKVIPQVLHLVEKPFVTIATFDVEFLKAPEEVLISEMVEHQKYFPVRDLSGKLKNMFVITANVPPTDSIRNGNRKVLSARLSDGVFLYEQDLKASFEEWNEKLKNTTFQKGLGSVYDKTERLGSLVDIFSDHFEKNDILLAKKAAHICKADLASQMVGEFPELQGQMGKTYAHKKGEAFDVAEAIDEHWMPRGENSALPKTVAGTILSMTEKVDNLSSFFTLGLKPSSSSDPFALRRQALGLVRIILNIKKHILLEKLFPCEKAIRQEIVQFIQTRAKVYFSDLGFAKNDIEACFTVRSDDLYDIFLRLQALQKLKKQEALFKPLLEVYRRSRGQCDGTHHSFTKALLKEKEEIVLAETYERVSKELSKAIEVKEYETAFFLLTELQKPLDELFSNVKVLADDVALKENRLSLLEMVLALFSTLLDFHKIL